MPKKILERQLKYIWRLSCVQKYNTSNNDTIWEANLSSEKNIKEYYIKSINDKAYIFTHLVILKVFL